MKKERQIYMAEQVIIARIYIFYHKWFKVILLNTKLLMLLDIYNKIKYHL